VLRARTNPTSFVPAAFSAAGSSEKIPAELKEVLNEVGLTGKCRWRATLTATTLPATLPGALADRPSLLTARAAVLNLPADLA
jgi:hypothetical protein